MKEMVLTVPTVPSPAAQYEPKVLRRAGFPGACGHAPSGQNPLVEAREKSVARGFAVPAPSHAAARESSITELMTAALNPASEFIPPKANRLCRIAMVRSVRNANDCFCLYSHFMDVVN